MLRGLGPCQFLLSAAALPPGLLTAACCLPPLALSSCSPQDKRIVREPASEAHVWWGEGSHNYEMDERCAVLCMLHLLCCCWARRGAAVLLEPCMLLKSQPGQDNATGLQVLKCCPRPTPRPLAPPAPCISTFTLNRERAVDYLNQLERLYGALQRACLGARIKCLLSWQTCCFLAGVVSPRSRPSPPCVNPCSVRRLRVLGPRGPLPRPCRVRPPLPRPLCPQHAHPVGGGESGARSAPGAAVPCPAAETIPLRHACAKSRCSLQAEVPQHVCCRAGCRPSEEELANFGRPDFTVYNAGAFPANRFTSYMTSGTSVDISFAKRELVGWLAGWGAR